MIVSLFKIDNMMNLNISYPQKYVENPKKERLRVRLTNEEK